MESTASSASAAEPMEPPQWRPLNAIDRRVIGVLVEKAKTVPASYPMTLNAICVGANQKSNRDPEMNLSSDDVEVSLDRLRELGAVGEVHGDGRVPKYRQCLYKWMGVEKPELAVMCELLLRGPQTVGELRSRAARMEPIADLTALKPILDSLIRKGLVIALSPEGRGQVVSHALFMPQEMDKVKSQLGMSGALGGAPMRDATPSRPTESAPAASSFAAAPGASSQGGSPQALPQAIGELRAEITELRQTVEDLRREVADLARRLTDAGA